ncbi:uncharacterized protein BXZ73DRAFT_77456 [Epithele typhae]|uniref:uncharacterized protein n=1 Tax=Epithele typhae TaxID=378194 RepID=UPI00200773E4|nr:uncharacterized protein BXZ73DRAFT_77456 [Epithele typhae]KAH9932753.1 hypothetical protein BXZ73DRAFT_77456 [Epithele typhae]
MEEVPKENHVRKINDYITLRRVFDSAPATGSSNKRPADALEQLHVSTPPKHRTVQPVAESQTIAGKKRKTESSRMSTNGADHATPTRSATKPSLITSSFQPHAPSRTAPRTLSTSRTQPPTETKPASSQAPPHPNPFRDRQGRPQETPTRRPRQDPKSLRATGPAPAPSRAHIPTPSPRREVARSPPPPGRKPVHAHDRRARDATRPAPSARPRSPAAPRTSDDAEARRARREAEVAERDAMERELRAAGKLAAGEHLPRLRFELPKFTKRAA